MQIFTAMKIIAKLSQLLTVSYKTQSCEKPAKTTVQAIVMFSNSLKTEQFPLNKVIEISTNSLPYPSNF